MKLALHLPINSVSFGQVSILLLRTIYEREKAGDHSVDWFIFPIGQVDVSANDGLPEDFLSWLNQKVLKSLESYTRDIPIFKLWHLRNESIESYSTKQTLLSFYELDRPTKVEINIAQNNKTLFTSKYTCEVFSSYGLETQYLPLAFDTYSFKKLNKTYHTDGRICFNVCGKFENRKRHAKIIKAWIKAFGSDKKYALRCATYNPFLNPQQNNQIIGSILEGKPKPFNVEFLPNLKENSMYNDFLNSGDIIIGMSGGEGWGLPEFQSVGIGKHAVILNSHGYKSWANESNSVLVKPSSKISSVDNMFFREGDIFNQGSIFDWNEDDFIEGCKKAINRVETDKLNKEGLKLPDEFSKEKFLDNVINFTK